MLWHRVSFLANSSAHSFIEMYIFFPCHERSIRIYSYAMVLVRLYLRTEVILSIYPIQELLRHWPHGGAGGKLSERLHPLGNINEQSVGLTNQYFLSHAAIVAKNPSKRTLYFTSYCIDSGSAITKTSAALHCGLFVGNVLQLVSLKMLKMQSFYLKKSFAF